MNGIFLCDAIVHASYAGILTGMYADQPQKNLHRLQMSEISFSCIVLGSCVLMHLTHACKFMS